MTQLCSDAKVEYVFNVKSCFRNFMIENMPTLEVAGGADKKSMTASDRSASS